MYAMLGNPGQPGFVLEEGDLVFHRALIDALQPNWGLKRSVVCDMCEIVLCDS